MFSAIIPNTALSPLSRALRSSNCLRCLHLENCSLSGRPIALLAAGLRSNQSLQELYLSENRLSPTDATHLRALITLSQALTLLDVRNNNIQVYINNNYSASFNNQSFRISETCSSYSHDLAKPMLYLLFVLEIPCYR